MLWPPRTVDGRKFWFDAGGHRIAALFVASYPSRRLPPRRDPSRRLPPRRLPSNGQGSLSVIPGPSFSRLKHIEPHRPGFDGLFNPAGLTSRGELAGHIRRVREVFERSGMARDRRD
jgi:hypothetical protein